MPKTKNTGALKQRFIEDNQEHRIAVLLPVDKYNKMLEQLEEMDDIRAYDAAKALTDEVIPSCYCNPGCAPRRNGGQVIVGVVVIDFHNP